jgi:hypothetical protein
MGFTEFSQNVFSGNSFEKEKPDYHTITTDHPWMIQLGLGSFTTGILQKWWDVTDQNGAYKNRPLFGGGLSAWGQPGFITSPWDYLVVAGPRGHHFDAWRQNERNYIKYNDVSDPSSKWKFAKIENGALVQDYTWQNHLDFIDFNNALYTKVNASDDPEDTAVGGHRNIDTSLCNIIEMNNYVRLKKTYTPDETIWNDNDRSRAEFIRDIKSAKMGGGVTWSGYLPFEFNINSLTNCTKYDWVKFNLQLFDSNRPKQTNRALAVSDFKIAGTPIDVMGQAYANRTKEDGEFGQPSIKGDTGATAVGDLDKSFNEYTGKWQSGTPQVIARLMTDIPAAVNESNVEPSVEAQQGATITDLLDKNHAAYEHAQTGTAMPITMQNGNPLQWAPQYAEPKGCRKNNNKKTVTVVNLAPRTWASGQMVVLNKIDGIWFPLEFGAPTDVVPPSVFEGKWDFTYLMTNVQSFFHSNPTQFEYQTFHFDDYEKLYYKKYYTDTNNKQFDITDFSPDGEGWGFLQSTSFDFMGSEIGGTRTDGHAIAQTQAALDVEGESLGENGDGRNVTPIHSAPFFGCVFPGGYNGDPIYAAYNLNTIGTKAYDPSTSSPSEKFIVDSTAFGFIGMFSDSNNKNVNDGTANGTKGMFAENNSNLVHLPADIALNASPSGTNGRPISSVQTIGQFISPIQVTADIVSNASKYFESTNGYPKRYTWAYKEAASNNTFTKYDSAWDLSPKVGNIIQFRPLMTEVYASFEHDDTNSAQTQSPNERGEFGARAWQMVAYGDYPLSKNAYNRAGVRIKSPGTGPSNESLSYTKGDISGDVDKKISSDKVSEMWVKPWNAGGDTGAGALGIISAVCTCGATSKITFNADCYLGMQSWFHFGGNNPWYQAFGGGNRPQDTNMTMLYARVFTAWPRDLTVYDPRFFSVFHFNYGAGVATTGELWHFNGSLVSDQSTVPSPRVEDYPSQFYEVDESYSDVDYRIPTWTDGTDPIEGTVTDNVPILGGTKIVKNSKLRQAKDWKIYGTAVVTDIASPNGAQRRGKLLPIDGGFNYRKRTIGIGDPNNNTMSHYTIGVPASNNTAVAEDHDVMIVNAGTGYSMTDTFKVSNANGHSVLLNPTNAGPITGFKVVDSPVTLKDGSTLPNPQTGADFQPSDFLDHDDVLDGTNKPSAKITAVEATGAEFEGYFVRGWVQDSPILTDYGPKDAIDGHLQLSPNQPGGDNPSPSIVKMISETKTVEANFKKLADDGRYDVYLWMKNDITHCFADIDHAGASSASTQRIEQQFINLEILPE